MISHGYANIKNIQKRGSSDTRTNNDNSLNDLEKRDFRQSKEMNTILSVLNIRRRYKIKLEDPVLLMLIDIFSMTFAILGLVMMYLEVKLH